MKILEWRDPKKNKKRRIIEPLPFLRSSYSAAEIPEKKICELLTTCYREKPNFKFRIFTHFLTNKIVLMKQQQKQIQPDLIIQNSGLGFRKNMW